MRELALFAGAGGGILGGHLLGWRTVCAVELDAYCAAVLAQRQTDGLLPLFPIWSDVRTFDGRPWRGIVDVVSGGFPCQDISVAGKGDGLDGERSGLWVEMARIIGEVGPRFVYVENSPALTARGLGRVLGDLAAMGFDAEWGVVSAADVGAPHRRERIWIAAHADGERAGQPGGGMGKVGPIRYSLQSMARRGMLTEWRTPCAADARGSSGANRDGRQVQLVDQVRHMIPTPTAGDAKSSGSRNTAMSNAHPAVSLTDWVRGDDGKGRISDTECEGLERCGGGTQGNRKSPNLGTVAVQMSGATGRLNPEFVEWLMGWPIGWTDLKPLGMDKFREWQQQHGDC